MVSSGPRRNLPINSHHIKVVFMFAVRAVRAINIALLILVLSSCLPVEEPGCEKPFAMTLIPDEIRGGAHIYVRGEALSFMDDPNLVLNQAELQVSVRGRKKGSELSLALNGLKVVRRDGAPLVDSVLFDADKNVTHVKMSLHKMFVNGATPFHLFVAHIRRHKGELKLSLLGHAMHITEAKLVFRGKRHESCEPKPEDPPPGGRDPGKTTISETIPAEALTKSTSIQITFKNTIAANLLYCSLDGAAASLCRSPQLYSSLDNGPHTFSVFARTPSGVDEATPATYQWTVDSLPPKASISNAAQLPSLSNADTLLFELASSEPGQLLCSLDGAPFTPCQSPHRVSDLAEGVHSFQVNVIDAAGNQGETPDVFQWSVDRTAPVASIVSVEPAAAVSNAVHKEFAFTASEAANFECSVDHGAFATCASPLVLSHLTEGRHWFEVRARDLAGNEGPASSYSWNIDLTDPVLLIDAFSPAQGLTNSKSVSVEFSVSELASVFCSWDNESAALCQSPYVLNDLNEGAHRLRLYARDEAGNESPEARLDWLMDFTSPELSFGLIQPAGSHINSRELSVAVNASEDARLQAWLNGDDLGEVQSPVLLQALDEGAYVFTVRARDSAGNLSTALIHDFVVDRTPPVVKLSANDNSTPVKVDHRLFSFVAGEEVSFECQLDGAGFAPCTSPVALAGLADGPRVFQVRARDLSGNISEPAAMEWVVDTTAPQIFISAQLAADWVTFRLSADEEIVGFECSMDQAPFTACPAEITYAGLAVGPHTFRARAKDIAGNGDDDGTTFNFDVRLPVETYITSPPVDLTNQRSMVIHFSANQPVAGFFCALDGPDFTPCTSPATFSDLVDGEHRLQVYAVDLFGNADISPASYSWSVDATAPVVAGPSLQTGRTVITLSWVTNEPATAQVRYGVDSSINQETVESANFVTSHSVQLTGLTANTTYTLQVTGRDRAGNIYLSAPQTTRTAR